MIAAPPPRRFRDAARAYLVYGAVYWIGGLYLVAQGIGVAGAATGGPTGSAVFRWALIGLIPLVVVPLLLARPWSWFGGVVSRRTFAWLVTALLAVRAYKVGQVAVRGGGSVPAPWGGEVGFQPGAVVFLAVTLVALLFVGRAAWYGEGRSSGARRARAA